MAYTSLYNAYYMIDKQVSINIYIIFINNEQDVTLQIQKNVMFFVVGCFG